MKCFYCNKEINKEKETMRIYGSKGKRISSNPDYDKHMRYHINIWKRSSGVKK